MATSVIEDVAGTPAAAPAADTPTPDAARAVSAPVVPETYDLKVPDGSTVAPEFVERTAATARELGLTNDAAQKLLDREVKDAAERETAAQAALTKAHEDSRKALVDAWSPNGEEWKKQQDAWTKASKADPDIGGDKFSQSVELAGKAVERFGTPEFKGMLEETGFGRHPLVLRFLATIGAASQESKLATNGAPTGGGAKSMVNRWYGKSTPEPE